MADESSGDKTEKATPKRMRDARRRGDVAKSQDLGRALGLLAIVLVGWQLARLAPARLASLLDTVLAAAGGAPGQTSAEDFAQSLGAVASEAFVALLLLSALVLLPIAFVGLLVEFLQTGPVLTLDKLAPKLSNLDPVEGLKRMFGADNVVELAMSVLHTAILIGIATYVVLAALPEVLLVTHGSPLGLAEALLHVSIRLFGWTLGAFVLVAALDVAWQRHSFEKKMRMSLRDIRDEHKSDEGDPQLKGQRRQLAREWARDGATAAAGRASVLVVNPVHVAIAVLYDEKAAPVPKVIGRGEDELALDMREAARAADVPVLRNEQLARTLLKDTEDGQLVPRELFAVVAEVTLWAMRARERMARERRGEAPDPDEPALPVPGEDLSAYPDAVR